VVQEPPDARQYLRAVYKSTQILMDMITAMLDLAKLEAGEMVLNVGPVSLHEVAGEVEEGMRSLLETKGLKLSMEISDDLPLLSADRESLRRILMNILSNAIAYSPKEGRIALAAHAGDGEVRAEMRDEGPGIPPEYREKIFEKFGQVESRQSGRKYSTGLGLTYCKMAVESQGGRIGVESEVGKGSTFWIVLPVAT
jgi:signal transduction histidine kinase